MGKREKFRYSIININWFKIVLISFSLVSIGIIGAVFLFYYYHFPMLTDDNELWAHFGDFVGGTLSSIFSFFTFIAILYTLHLQREELSLNREELRLNRLELQTANKEAGNQTRIASKQLENSIRQKNEEYLLNYMKVYSEIELNLIHRGFPNTTGAALIESFLNTDSKIKVTTKLISIEDAGMAISTKLILKYLNCLEYLIYWDLLQCRSETFDSIVDSEHQSFSSDYSPFIKSFCNDATFVHLRKSGIIAKMKIEDQFPNIARFINQV
ncbi:hypothetical protein LPTSP2_36640 [Leptospira ellinghausenii]|uniref:Phage abortive infection protein n=1 Tax=Leptospira ellinghausenii TaxID=1917822 RepID=A0A2P2DID2_9LEPT|nr:hypothetical protein [Leptospira ellinghausenii]GBF44361.1 hypothetical protein LPTSP2_36640 [Leptospira ellinghausenii]